MRSEGALNSDHDMMKLRIKLRDCLESRKKRKKRSTKLVPRLLNVKTVTFENTEKYKPSIKKFVLLGTLIAIGGVVYYYFK
jgi:hypothetical protein